MGLFNRTKNVDVFFIGCDGTDIDRGIYSFYLDLSNGHLIKKGFVKSPANPLSMIKEGRWVYIGYRNASGSNNDGGIQQYAAMDKQLGLTARVSNKGRTYIDMCINKDSTNLYAVDYYHGDVVKSTILKSKVVNIKLQDTLKGKSIDPIKQTESHPSFITFDKEFNKVIVADTGGDEIVVYDVIEHGKLVRNEDCSFKVNEGYGPSKILFNNKGNIAFILNEISSKIQVFGYEEGHFTLKSEVPTYLVEEFDGENIPTDMIISESNEFLFVTNKGDDTLVVFDINDEDGALTRIDCMEVEAGPKCMLLSQDRWIVVCSKQAGIVETFEIKTEERNGILFETHSTFSLHAPECIVAGAKNQKVVN